MAIDPITGVEIPDGNTPPALDTEGKGTPPAGGDTGDKFKFAGREFDDSSMAEKSYTEMQSRATKAEQENAAMLKRIEQAENPLLQKLVEATAAKTATPEQTEAEKQQARDNVLRDLDERGNEAVIDLMAGMANDVEANIDSKYRAELEKRDAEIAELKGGFTDYRDTNSEIYKENKDRIDKLQAEGFTRAQALTAVKVLPSTAPAMPAPAGTGGSGTGGHGTEGGSGWSNEDMAKFRQMVPNATPAEIEDFKRSGRKAS